ncbi:hypothetical protein KPL78_19015 [Roseomonas sp. HJA6]|uniref:Mu DNA binding I gamma subdomain domain-containing protein n=1 Tax=Roseomonas alba TaxID=2846776 RepID=A0ABS7ACC2_9PROT|nr:hypothetical protein [Neoroseomonas alba]
MSGLHPEVSAFLQAEFLRLERPSMADCLRRALAFALKNDLPEPSDHAMRRAIKALPPELVSVMREGRRAAASSSRAVSAGSQSQAPGQAGTMPIPQGDRSP